VSAAPAISVVVLSYNARERIDLALGTLRAQTIDEPYEVIVVDSGDDGTDAYVRAEYPEVRLIHSADRLGVGAARNRGTAAARGPYVAFLADDCRVAPDWLERRVARHRDGFEAVGGAVTNGTPFRAIGSAGYYLEYTGVMPSARILADQDIPHGLSYSRALLERFGGFREDLVAGEDTYFNRRCVQEGVAITVDPAIRLAHRNITSLGPYLRHQRVHGRAIVQFRRRSGRGGAPLGAWWAYVTYPRTRWWNGLKRVARGRPRWLPGYLALSPLIWAGAVAAGAGARAEARAARHAAGAQWAGAEPAPDAAE
jgi:glycosyltransferase involved in cell wall biosynthesis